MTATVDKQLRHAADDRPAPATVPPKAEKVRDPRYLALRNFALSISVLNILGYTVLGFEQPWLWPIIAVLTGYVTEIVFELISAWAQERAPRFLGRGARGMYEFLLPAHITALAANMLIYANNQLWPVIFTVVVGVIGKHAFQAPIAGRMRHFMNPSNLGITAALLCFGSWLSIAPPYQFTENASTLFRVGIPLLIVTAGTVINAMLTRKTALIVGWLGAFVIQALLRYWLQDLSLSSALGPMTGVAFVLFTNYMISDPGTTPFSARNQFMFGSAVAFTYGILMLFNVVYTLFFAVTIVCAARGIGWWVTHYVRKRASARRSTAVTGSADAFAV